MASFLNDHLNERQKYNLEIVEKLKDFFEKNPDLRFFQGLVALNIVEFETIDKGYKIEHKIIDKFHEESKVTYKKVKIF